MKVRLANGVVEVELIRKNTATVVVKLPDGNVIRRKLKDVIEE